MAKILVLDDSPALGDMISQMLKLGGHDVAVFNSGKEALKQLASEPFDLLLTDVFMPDMDGLEVILQVKKLKPGLKLVAMSSQSGIKNMLPAAKAFGAQATLHKPFDFNTLTSTVTQVLSA